MTHENLKAKEVPSYFILINFLSACIGLLWSYFASNILIDLLTFIGIIAQINSTYIGLTILALGNALPDALTVIMFSK